MNNELYFLPLIEQAFTQKDPQVPLHEIFEKIKELGGQDQNRVGYSQFCAFMDLVRQHDEANNMDALLLVIVDMALDESNDLSEKTSRFIERVMSDPDLKAGYELLQREIRELETEKTEPVLDIFYNRVLLQKLVLPELPGTIALENLTPGFYQIQLSTGRVIWQDMLTAEDLLWSKAYPMKQLELAAETDETKPDQIRSITTFQESITIRIYPGIEGGSMELEFLKP
jgi:hypothetical protein